MQPNEETIRHQNNTQTSVDDINFDLRCAYDEDGKLIEPRQNSRAEMNAKDKDTIKSNKAQDKCIRIKPIEFETVYWLDQFLDSLFQLKPVLRTSITYDKFRIVIEFYSGGKENKFDIGIVEEVVDKLRDTGCKVPVLIYSDIILSKTLYQRVMHQKKKYLMLFCTNDIREVKKFCKMEHMRDEYGQANSN